MRLYYICSRDIAAGHAHLFRDSHYAALPDGNVLLSATFHTTKQQDDFEALPGVEPLPHPYDPTPLDDKHISALAHAGVRKGHTTKEMRKFMKAKNCLL